MLAQSGVTLFLFGSPGSVSGNAYEPPGVSPPPAVGATVGDFLPAGVGDFLSAGVAPVFLLIFEVTPPPPPTELYPWDVGLSGSSSAGEGPVGLAPPKSWKSVTAFNLLIPPFENTCLRHMFTFGKSLASLSLKVLCDSKSYWA